MDGNLNTENIARSSFEETTIEDGFLILAFKNEENTSQNIVKEINSDFIQFHFCVKGLTKFVFNQGLLL